MGVSEWGKFRKGSKGIMKEMIEAGKRGATTIVCGGDTVQFLDMYPGAESAMTHVSTGGAAS